MLQVLQGQRRGQRSPAPRKQRWLQDSALSSSLSLQHLQHPFHREATTFMTRKMPFSEGKGTLWKGKGHLHCVSASTRSLGLSMRTKEILRRSVDQMDPVSVSFPATLTVSTSSQPQPSPGASLSLPARSREEFFSCTAENRI